jgi:hypothetical protein
MSFTLVRANAPKVIFDQRHPSEPKGSQLFNFIITLHLIILIVTSYICKYLSIYFIVAFSTNHNFFPFGPNLMLVTQILGLFRYIKNRVCVRKFRYIAIPCLLELSVVCLLNLHLVATGGTLCCYFIIQLYHRPEVVLGVADVLFFGC